MTHKNTLFPYFFMLLSLAPTSIAHNQTQNENQFLCSNGTKNRQVPPPTDHWTQSFVQLKDVQIQPATGLSGRLYLPKTAMIPFLDLPLIVYFHGGAAFCSGSAFSPPYHKYSAHLAVRANAVVLSVEYRSAPTHPIRVGFDDSWAALRWAVSHSRSYRGPNPGQDPWLKHFTDFNRIFLAGDGVGANIAHNMGIRVGLENLGSVNISGIILIHPLLWGEKVNSNNEWGERRIPIYDAEEWKAREWVSKLWGFVCPFSIGLGDPCVNPAKDPNLWRMGCKRVMVFVAGDDPAAKGNYGYVAALRESGWRGVVEVMESKGKKNGFYLDPNYANGPEAMDMMKRVVYFMYSRKI